VGEGGAKRRMRAGARSATVVQAARPSLRSGPHPPTQASLRRLRKLACYGHLVWGVFCQVFCCRSFLSRKSAIFTLAERASPAVIDPFVWSPGPAACHWSASLPFLRKRSGVKGAQRRFAGLPLIPDRFRNLLQRSAPMALSVQPPRIQQLYKLDRSEREPAAIGRGSCLLCERTRHSLVCGEISRSRP